MVSNEQLADWIEQGVRHPCVVEDRNRYLARFWADEFHCGVVALAAVGKLGDPQTVLDRIDRCHPRDAGPAVRLATLLGIPATLASRISREYRKGKRLDEIVQGLRHGEYHSDTEQP